MNSPVSIRSIASVSALGSSSGEAWTKYQDSGHLFQKTGAGGGQEWVGRLSEQSLDAVESIRQEDSKYRNLDASVLYAIYTARYAVRDAGWNSVSRMGINIGSSRGATALFEDHHRLFLESGRTPALTSPSTTLGNISSWVAHDLGSKGPEFSHSITCSTALHALLNGLAWIRSGMADRFLVGGSEAPLTLFTLAQMKALKIYASCETKSSLGGYPCRSMDMRKTANGMVLGEGASMACLERGVTSDSLAEIEGVGYATEPLEHSVSISTEAQCFQRSMKMALGNVSPSEVDVIVMHAPGTIKGDKAEWAAIEVCFGKDIPALTGNKWKIGHTFAASGMLSIEMAVMMLLHQKFISVPYMPSARTPPRIRRIMVNSVGFGGNAVSVLLKAP